MIELSVEDARDIAFALVEEMMTSVEEEMPHFDTRYPHRLESVLTAPFASFGGEEQYPTLEEKAAVLFYACCKDHPMKNGNKRMAVVLTGVFMYLNGYFPQIDPMKLYDVARLVSDSRPSQRNKVVSSLKTLFKTTMVPVAEVESRLLGEGDDKAA